MEKNNNIINFINDSRLEFNDKNDQELISELDNSIDNYVITKNINQIVDNDSKLIDIKQFLTYLDNVIKDKLNEYNEMSKNNIDEDILINKSNIIRRLNYNKTKLNEIIKNYDDLIRYYQMFSNLDFENLLNKCETLLNQINGYKSLFKKINIDDVDKINFINEYYYNQELQQSILKYYRIFELYPKLENKYNENNKLIMYLTKAKELKNQLAEYIQLVIWGKSDKDILSNEYKNMESKLGNNLERGRRIKELEQLFINEGLYEITSKFFINDDKSFEMSVATLIKLKLTKKSFNIVDNIEQINSENRLLKEKMKDLEKYLNEYRHKNVKYMDNINTEELILNNFEALKFILNLKDKKTDGYSALLLVNIIKIIGNMWNLSNDDLNNILGNRINKINREISKFMNKSNNYMNVMMQIMNESLNYISEIDDNKKVSRMGS